MKYWIITANLVLIAAVVGAFSACMEFIFINEWVALALSFVILILSMGSSFLIVKKSLSTGEKRYLLWFACPILILLSVVVFRVYIMEFFHDLFMPIGPGGLPTDIPPEWMN